MRLYSCWNADHSVIVCNQQFDVEPMFSFLTFCNKTRHASSVCLLEALATLIPTPLALFRSDAFTYLSAAVSENSRTSFLLTTHVTIDHAHQTMGFTSPCVGVSCAWCLFECHETRCRMECANSPASGFGSKK